MLEISRQTHNRLAGIVKRKELRVLGERHLPVQVGVVVTELARFLNLRSDVRRQLLRRCGVALIVIKLLIGDEPLIVTKS